MTKREKRFFQTGGTLSTDAPCYVERKADIELFSALMSGRYCYVLDSRQVGKSSLMIRTAAKLVNEGLRVAIIDLSEIGRPEDQEKWYFGQLFAIGEQLGMATEIEVFWQSHTSLGFAQRFITALMEVLVEPISSPLVVFIDEIDCVKGLAFSTDEYFHALQECFNRRARNADAQKLSFCLLGSATPSQLISIAEPAPFNIGERILLIDFTENESIQLSMGFGLGAEKGTEIIRRVWYWTAGHPYLTVRLCRAIAEQLATVNNHKSIDVDKVYRETFLSEGAKDHDDNLTYVQEYLLRNNSQRIEILSLYQSVLSKKLVLDNKECPINDFLKLSGIVCKAKDRIVVRNRIYESVFNFRWIMDNMPDAWNKKRSVYKRLKILRLSALFLVATILLSVYRVHLYNTGSQMYRLHTGSGNRILLEIGFPDRRGDYDTGLNTSQCYTEQITPLLKSGWKWSSNPSRSAYNDLLKVVGDGPAKIETLVRLGEITTAKELLRKSVLTDTNQNNRMMSALYLTNLDPTQRSFASHELKKMFNSFTNTDSDEYPRLSSILYKLYPKGNSQVLKAMEKLVQIDKNERHRLFEFHVLSSDNPHHTNRWVSSRELENLMLYSIDREVRAKAAMELMWQNHDNARSVLAATLANLSFDDLWPSYYSYQNLQSIAAYKPTLTRPSTAIFEGVIRELKISMHRDGDERFLSAQLALWLIHIIESENLETFSKKLESISDFGITDRKWIEIISFLGALKISEFTKTHFSKIKGNHGLEDFITYLRGLMKSPEADRLAVVRISCARALYFTTPVNDRAILLKRIRKIALSENRFEQRYALGFLIDDLSITPDQRYPMGW